MRWNLAPSILPMHVRAVSLRGKLWLLVAFVAGFLAAIALDLPLAARSRGSSGSPPKHYVTVSTTLHAGGGRQLAMVVLGSSTCGASQGTQVARALLALRDSLRMLASLRSIPFVSIGVAIEPDPRLGIEWLDQLGGFDEVSAGQGWMNTLAAEHVWREPNALGATPQVIIVIRSIRGDDKTRLRVLPTIVLVRMVGAHDISTMAGLADVDSLVRVQMADKTPKGD